MAKAVAVVLFWLLCAAREGTVRGLDDTLPATPTLPAPPTQTGGVIYKTRFLDWRFGTNTSHTTAWNILISIALVLFAGFASGMTVGLLSIDNLQLKILQEEGTQEERRQARQLEAVLANHHLLLVTLLLANSIAMEALPIFLNKTVPEWAAVALSVTAILAFGEVLPQALCTGRWQIPIVMKALPIIDALIFLLYGLSWPIAKILDHILGHDAQTYYARSHLKALIRIHQKERRAGVEAHNKQDEEITNSDMGSALGADEVIVIEGALDLATKMVEDIMVPMDDVYMLEWDTLLTPDIRRELLEKGHSRVPIYKTYRHNVKGLLLIKSLICLDTHESPKVGDLLKLNRPPLFCLPSLQLYDLLNEFQRGRHMAFVTLSPDLHKNSWRNLNTLLPSSPAPNEQLLGIATLEDVIEELIQEEIYDEFDHYQSTAMLPRTARSNSVDTAEANTAFQQRQVLKDSSIFTHGPQPPEISSHTQTRAPTATHGSNRDSLSEVSPDTLFLATRSKRVRDAVKPGFKDAVLNYADLIGTELQDLNKRLIEAEEVPLFPVSGTTETGPANAKRLSAQFGLTSSKRMGKSRTFIVKRSSDKQTSTDENLPPLTNPSPKAMSNSNLYRRYHSTDLERDRNNEILLAEPRSMRNLVGIATARQQTSRTKNHAKLCTIDSLTGLAQLEAPSYSPAKTEAEPRTEDDQYSPVCPSEGRGSRSDIVFTADT